MAQSPVLSLDQMIERLKIDGSITVAGAADTHVKHEHSSDFVHHNMVLQEQAKSERKNWSCKLPVCSASNITRMVPKEGGSYPNWFFHVDIYPKWPLGKNKGEDPQGDKLLEFLQSMEKRYNAELLANPDVMAKIYAHIGEAESLDRDGNILPQKTPLEMMEPVVCRSKFPAGHAMAGKIDDSKSPTFKVKLWDSKISATNQPREDSLKVCQARTNNGRPAVDAKGNDVYRMFLWTTIYDMRTNYMNKECLKTENQLNEFVYTKGDAKGGSNYPFKLMVAVELLAPSVFWSKGKKATLQLKASTIFIYKKVRSERRARASPEELLQQQQEAMAAMAAFGWTEEDCDDGVDSAQQQQYSDQMLQQQQQQPGSPYAGGGGGYRSGLDRYTADGGDGSPDRNEWVETDPPYQQQQQQQQQHRLQTRSVVVMPNRGRVQSPPPPPTDEEEGGNVIDDDGIGGGLDFQSFQDYQESLEKQESAGDYNDFPSEQQQQQQQAVADDSDVVPPAKRKIGNMAPFQHQNRVIAAGRGSPATNWKKPRNF